MNPTFIYRSNGTYVGFILNDYLYGVQGEGMGWIETPFVWDSGGRFRGNIALINGNSYIIRNDLAIPPVPRVAKSIPNPGSLPLPPQLQILPINLNPGIVDAF